MSQENMDVLFKEERSELLEGSLSDHLSEFKKREHVYLACISSLEKEICQTHTYLNEWRNMHMYEDEEGKASKDDLMNINSLRNLLIDPSINLEIKELRQKIYEVTKKWNLAEEKLQGFNFDAQSSAGQRLISKCKKLQDENYELGKTLEENTLQPLSIQIINMKEQMLFYKNELKILKELNADIDEDNELLSQQLGELSKKYTQISKEKAELEEKNLKLRNHVSALQLKLKAQTHPQEGDTLGDVGRSSHGASPRSRSNRSRSSRTYGKYTAERRHDTYSSRSGSRKVSQANYEDNHRIGGGYSKYRQDYTHSNFREDEEEDAWREGYKRSDSHMRERRSNPDDDTRTYYNDDNYRKRSSDGSRERKYRKVDRHHHRDRKTDREREKERDREKDKEKERERHKLKDKERSRKERGREKDKDKESERERDRDRSRDRGRDRDKDRGRDRDRERDKDRERERDRERDKGKDRTKTKEREKAKSKHKSKNKEKGKGKGKRDENYDSSNYSEPKRRSTKDYGDDRRDHSNASKNGDADDKAGEVDRYVYLHK
ncbi:Uncharacterized protein PCOAH_00053770 [Plasmodium coatneyi]|uniref:Negative elongation factor E n=1 Tax=Plasmodium coatneyi TaxID=208452 RepID=A0A1B1E818_9APIC|nr:Uncharacterized protein PCOAH_00053770 [Plasmodium coatneyi]ANQ11166.1 Uncharacterized protein PCOAH_00053770 [Plasmodium coatneyi]